MIIREETPADIEAIHNVTVAAFENHPISPIENLQRIQQVGAVQWLKEQEEPWSCPQCGGSMSIIDNTCYDCGFTI